MASGDMASMTDVVEFSPVDITPGFAEEPPPLAAIGEALLLPLRKPKPEPESEPKLEVLPATGAGAGEYPANGIPGAPPKLPGAGEKPPGAGEKPPWAGAAETGGTPAT